MNKEFSKELKMSKRYLKNPFHYLYELGKYKSQQL